MEGKKKILHDDEIDLLALVKVIWSRKWFVTKITGLFIVLGLIIAFTSPKEFKASSVLIPEAAGEEGKLGGSLGGLASLAGVDLGGLSGRSQTINPALYQSVSRSTPFLLELMNEKYFFTELGREISVYDYYSFHFKLGLLDKIISVPSSLFGWLRGNQIGEKLTLKPNVNALIVSKDQQGIIEDLKSRVFVEMDWELNVVTIEVEMQDPVVSAQMAQFTQEYITQYVSEYSLSKSQQQLESIEQQYQQRKKDFENIQYRLAAFKDKNRNVTTARAQSEEERLQSEYNLAFNVYNQLAQQREATKLQIKESTPIFTVLEPIKIPVDNSKPRRLVILIVSVFLGIIISSLIIIIQNLNK